MEVGSWKSGVDLRRLATLVVTMVCALTWSFEVSDARQAPTVPDAPLRFGVFSAQFRADGTFSLSGEGWPSMQGTWTLSGSEMVLRLAGVPAECAEAASYRVVTERTHLTLALIKDACTPRRMILDRSQWRPASETIAAPERRITRTVEPRRGPLPRPAPSTGQWPSTRPATIDPATHYAATE